MISVVVNSYYRIDFLEAALESVCNQTGSPEYEVILATPLDPCPYSAEFGRRFGRLGVEFKEVSLGPGGTGRYLSAATSASRGDVLTIIDDDDLWSMFSRHPEASFLHNGCRLIDEKGRSLPPWSLHRLARHRSTLRREGKESIVVPATRRSLRELSGFEPSFNNSSIAIRRETLLAHLSELEQIEGGEDAFLYFCGVASGKPLMATSQRLTFVRVHRMGATADIRTLVERNLRRNLLCQRLKEQLGPTNLSKMVLKEQAFWELVKGAVVDSANTSDSPHWIRTILRLDDVPPSLIDILAIGLGAVAFASPRLAHAAWRGWRAAW
jgi:hypothetical protein